MLNCRAAAERLSRSFDAPLPALDRLSLGAHLVLCPSCRRFRSQIRAVHTASVRALMGADDQDSDAARATVALTDDSKRRITSEMERQT